MSDIKTASTRQYLRIYFPNHGIPFIPVTDNGSTFSSNEFKLFTTKNGVKHVTAPPFHSEWTSKISSTNIQDYH